MQQHSDPGGRQRTDKPCRQPRRGRHSGKWKMADILADYREWREQQAARISTHSDGCHMWHKDCMIHRLADALAVEQAKRTPAEPSTPGEGTRQAGCTLTDEEREAIEDAVQAGEFDAGLFDCEWARKHAATLRGLLERTKC